MGPLRLLLTTALALGMAACALAGPIDRLRSLYRDPTGTPSYRQLELVHGLAASQETFAWTPVFTVTQVVGEPQATPLSLDVRFERTRTWRAPYIAKPVWDARVYESDGKLLVGGFSDQHNERPVGMIDELGRFVRLPGVKQPEDFPLLALPAESLLYDPFAGRLVQRVRAPAGPIVEKTDCYLPLRLLAASGGEIGDVAFALRRPTPERVTLVATVGGREYELARADLTGKSTIANRPGYRPGLAAGCTQLTTEATTVLEVKGEINIREVIADGPMLVVRAEEPLTPALSLGERGSPDRRSGVAIDGDFTDWRNVPGVADARGDTPAYLAYNPDTDILEFKVTNDDRYLYLYSRVAGRHGRTLPPEGRYYWYAYVDVDADPGTGYLPTRDDNCYYGVDLGDDAEVQFEFVGGRFVKTFWGFCGVGTEKEALAGAVTLGPSFYGKTDEQGRPRDRYKVEFVKIGDRRQETADFTPGTSEDIIMALSADGSECEVRAELAGFLRQANGRPVLAKGSVIDVAVGVEASGEAVGSKRWGADSSPVMYRYRVQ